MLETLWWRIAAAGWFHARVGADNLPAPCVAV
jgi:hypothetical protein